jgi:hypothetical protein
LAKKDDDLAGNRFIDKGGNSMTESEIDPQAQAYLDALKLWITTYGIDFEKTIEGPVITEEQREILETLDAQNLVWTSTSDKLYYSNGLNINGLSCEWWESNYFFIGSKPWVGGRDSIEVEHTKYLPCSICNSNGTGAGEKGCPGPGIPEGAFREDCEDGHVKWYFD